MATIRKINIDGVDYDLDGGSQIVLSNIAPTYSNTNTYSVGDYVIYNGVLYVCNTAISVAEDFDSAKWTLTTITEIIGNISNVLATLTTPANEEPTGEVEEG